MTEPVAHKLYFTRTLLISAVGLVAVALPIVFGSLHAAQGRTEPQAQNAASIAPEFEVASIKPNKAGSIYSKSFFTQDGFTATNVTLRVLIRSAYAVEDHQISGLPKLVQLRKLR